MANKRRRKSKKTTSDMPVAQSCCEPASVDTGVEKAENGFIVRVSSNNLKKAKKGESSYRRQVFIAPTHEDAMRISTGAIHALGSKIKGARKKGSGKRISTKRMG